MNIDDISVEIRSTKQRGNMLGIASIKYLDPEKNGFRLSGFNIRIGKYSTGLEDKDGNFLWVTPPSFSDHVTGKMINIFFMVESLWKQLEAKIVVEYLKKVDER